jgi:beta-lactamase superfamily II metal-dependent hydrolase
MQRIFVSLLALILSLSLSAMEVTIFNVGQGNGTLTTFPKKPSLLIDCGSSQQPAGKNQNKAAIISAMVKKIEASGSKDLVIVASHPDIDHCNFLSEIAKECLKKDYKLTVLLGGSRSDYESKTKENFGPEFNELEKKCLEQKYTFKFRDEIKDMKEFCDKHLPDHCKVVASSTGNKNPNNDSIVMRVADGDFSVLFLGDATNKVTGPLTKEQLKSKVVILSHHGAELEKCTTEALLKKIDPDSILVSAGMHGQYRHPCAAPINRAITFLNLKISDPAKLGSPHCVNYYRGTQKISAQERTQEGFKPAITYQDGFATGLTRHALYTTSTEGHITITADRIRRTESSAGKTDGTAIITALDRSYAFTHKKYAFNSITRLNLTKLALNDDQLSSLEKLPEALEHADIRENNFTVKGIITMAKALEAHKIAAKIKMDTQYGRNDRDEDPILQILTEKKYAKSTVPYRMLHALEKVKGIADTFTTHACIWFIKKPT